MAHEQTTELQYSDTPQGWAQRLTREFEAARKALKDWHEQAEKAVKAFLDERASSEMGESRWNIYTADTQTQEAILFSNPPKVTVSRRFADANDDLARVAGEIQERLLNADVESEDDSFTQAIEYANSDRQRAGFGLCRVRYEMGETQEQPAQPAMLGPDGMERAPEVPAQTLKPNEKVETDWVFWGDVLWSPCRVWHEVTWLAFASDLSRAEVIRKFGQEVADDIQYRSKDSKDANAEQRKLSPWDRARIWEVWVKDGRQVFFFVEGYPQVLVPKGVETAENGGVPDPLELEGFWPCPRPMFANLTTSKLVPKPDREFAKDLYEEVNVLSTRIHMLEDAVRVVGVYSKENAGALGQMLKQAGNTMIPVDNWAAFAEKGGIKGVVDWFPLEQVVNALGVLQGQRAEKVEAIRQLTGMSDIMRGQASEPGATATEQRIKARFGSVRMERRQKELARFVSDLQRLRGEVMAKHFDESTYLARCNCEHTPDAQLAPEAVKLLKSDFAQWRIEVKPETISMTDFDALKQERTEVIMAVSQFLTAAAPLAQAAQGSMPFLLQILQWMVAGIRGSSEIEGVLDQAIQAAQDAASQPQQQQPDPKLQAQMLKGQQESQKLDKELQADLMRLQAEVQADNMREENQRTQNVQEHLQKEVISARLRPPPQLIGPKGRK